MIPKDERTLFNLAKKHKHTPFGKRIARLLLAQNKKIAANPIASDLGKIKRQMDKAFKQFPKGWKFSSEERKGDEYEFSFEMPVSPDIPDNEVYSAGSKISNKLFQHFLKNTDKYEKLVEAGSNGKYDGIMKTIGSAGVIATERDGSSSRTDLPPGYYGVSLRPILITKAIGIDFTKVPF